MNSRVGESRRNDNGMEFRKLGNRSFLRLSAVECCEKFEFKFKRIEIQTNICILKEILESGKKHSYPAICFNFPGRAKPVGLWNKIS